MIVRHRWPIAALGVVFVVHCAVVVVVANRLHTHCCYWCCCLCNFCRAHAQKRWNNNNNMWLKFSTHTTSAHQSHQHDHCRCCQRLIGQQFVCSSCFSRCIGRLVGLLIWFDGYYTRTHTHSSLLIYMCVSVFLRALKLFSLFAPLHVAAFPAYSCLFFGLALLVFVLLLLLCFAEISLVNRK